MSQGIARIENRTRDFCTRIPQVLLCVGYSLFSFMNPNNRLSFIVFSLSLSLSPHRKLRQRDSTVLRIQFCIAMILMLISFAAGIERVQLFEVCVTISALIHYLTLVSLLWMAAEALLVFQKAIISTNVSRKFFFIVTIVCWCKYIVLNNQFSFLVHFCCLVICCYWPLDFRLSVIIPSSFLFPHPQSCRSQL